MRPLWLALLLALACLSGRAQRTGGPLAPPVEDGVWIRPAAVGPAMPEWGLAGGIRVGLVPPGGPRGLLRIYTPYIGQPEDKVINFIALEPIPVGSPRRGLSELERSALDSVQGKRLWSGDDSLQAAPASPEYPVRGIIGREGKAETLTVWIFCERFDNGADVYVRLRFRSTEPRQFELAAYAAPGSAPLRSFVLTATMGNYARLRNLYLAHGEVKRAGELWPDYRGIHFAPHDTTRLSSMVRDRRGAAWLIAEPDEAQPSQAHYAPGTKSHWHYTGVVATQYWKKNDPPAGLLGLVNGRRIYWASQAPIPGGISYENFEMAEPFRQGATYIFGVEPGHADDLLRRIVR